MVRCHWFGPRTQRHLYRGLLRRWLVIQTIKWRICPTYTMRRTGKRLNHRDFTRIGFRWDALQIRKHSNVCIGILRYCEARRKAWNECEDTVTWTGHSAGDGRSTGMYHASGFLCYKRVPNVGLVYATGGGEYCSPIVSGRCSRCHRRTISHVSISHVGH